MLSLSLNNMRTLDHTSYTSGIGLSHSSSSESMSRLTVIGLGGVGSSSYHDADSSKTMSLLTRTFLVEGCKESCVILCSGIDKFVYV